MGISVMRDPPADCAMMWNDLGNIQSMTSLHGWMRLKPIVDPVIT